MHLRLGGSLRSPLTIRSFLSSSFLDAAAITSAVRFRRRRGEGRLDREAAERARVDAGIGTASVRD
jgi:hypothetical protein